MEFPHRRFILYLLSRGHNAWEIAAACTSRLLHPPNDEQLLELQEQLGEMPAYWEQEYNRSNIKFRRWLREKGIHDLWRQTDDVKEAEKFLYTNTIRKDFEALVLCFGSTERARTELLLKYSDKFVPGIDALNTFIDCFWAIGDMSQKGLTEFLEANDARADLLPHLQGEMEDTYGFLGLRQRVEDADLLNNFLAYANQQFQASRRVGGAHSGQKVAGMGTLLRASIDAMEKRREIEQLTGEGNDDLMKKAHNFKLGRLRRQRAIPSIDDLGREEAIEAEYEEIDNVREFPKSG